MQFNINFRKNEAANQYDVVRFYAPGSYDYDEKQKTNGKSNLDKIKLKTRNSMSSSRKNQRTNVHDVNRFCENESVNVAGKRRQTEIISPEDYDSDGFFWGLATKRRKVEQPVKIRVKRKPAPKRKPTPKVVAVILKNNF